MNMANWYKTVKRAWNRGIPLMDEYSRGDRPSSSEHRKDPRSLVNARPEFGGHKREGYPKGFQNVEDEGEYERVRGQLPGENVLMDQDPPTGEGVCHDEFVGRGESNAGEFYADNDRIPTENSKRLDNIKVGPHNMQKGNVFNKIRNKSRIKSFQFI
jgi:hypothetical protein